ncbi:MAG: FtsX-like permease family protein [Clostridia bacterium]
MSRLFYPKFAFNSIKKNKKLYIPYILTSVLWVMMYYIINALSISPFVKNLKGGSFVCELLGYGGGVMLVFSLIFLFYTSSFLSKRRNKEYALYNILGMNKKNIAHILLWDTIITFGISIIIGLLLGTVFLKIAELFLVNIINGEINYSLYISWETILTTILFFGAIFILILLKALFKIKITNPIELLHSENSGEKPPKANFILGILGFITLIVAYYLALTVQNPLKALSLFFIAVALVIIGTYLIFISGSVLLCKILQKNKSYYYKSSHFISVSSMVYRMKRNGAGLASICILATMVLVMISSTSSLYFGAKDAIIERYPRQLSLQFKMKDTKATSDSFIKEIDSFAVKECDKFNTTMENKLHYQMIESGGKLINGAFDLDPNNVTNSMENIYQLYLVPLEDYNRVLNKSETLKQNEALVYSTRVEFLENTITFKGGNSFNVVKHLDEFWSSSSAAMSIIPSLFIVVPDLEYATFGINSIPDFKGNAILNNSIFISFDTDLSEEQQTKLYNAFPYSSEAILRQNDTIASIDFECRASEEADFFALYGGLFFIGIILSLLFISAAVLIIYYKQIVEGYEDKNRFEIMQKVGMTKREIKKSINSQLLTVFFIPLIVSGMHLAFSFPIIKNILLMFNLSNIGLFAITTVISFIVFGLFYALVYRITSSFYYNIVSSKDDTLPL